MEEDYEAELQVKITARKDVDQKIEKVAWRWKVKRANTHICTSFKSAVLLPMLAPSQTLSHFCGPKFDIIQITKVP